MNAALRVVATDGHQDVADAVREARQAHGKMIAELWAPVVRWDRLADAADEAYLAIGRLAALARAASNH